MLLSTQLTVDTVSFITANSGNDIYAIKKPDIVTNRMPYIATDDAFITAIIDAFV